MKDRKTEMLRKQFNETIGQWIAWLDDYSFDRLCRRPAPAAWSVGQVYMHLLDETPYYLEQAKACLLNNRNSKKAMHTDAVDMFATNSFPDQLLHSPTNDPDISQPQSKENLWQHLLNLKEEVNQLFDLVDQSAATGKTKHPGLLYFNALEWLQFAEMHMRHHFRQKTRIDERLTLRR